MLDERTIRKVEGHLRGTFANARITLVPRPKQKDSAEVYIGDYFGGGIEGWFAYVVALAFLLVRPSGLFGQKLVERV